MFHRFCLIVMLLMLLRVSVSSVRVHCVLTDSKSVFVLFFCDFV